MSRISACDIKKGDAIFVDAGGEDKKYREVLSAESRGPDLIRITLERLAWYDRFSSFSTRRIRANCNNEDEG